MGEAKKASTGEVVLREIVRLVSLSLLVAWLWHGVGWAGNVYTFAQLAYVGLVLVTSALLLLFPQAREAIENRQRTRNPTWQTCLNLVSSAFHIAALTVFGHVALALSMLVAIAVTVFFILD